MRNNIWLLLIILLSGCANVRWDLGLHACTSATPEAYTRFPAIKAGMKREEVRAALGEPAKIFEETDKDSGKIMTVEEYRSPVKTQKSGIIFVHKRIQNRETIDHVTGVYDVRYCRHLYLIYPGHEDTVATTRSEESMYDADNRRHR